MEKKTGKGLLAAVDRRVSGVQSARAGDSVAGQRMNSPFKPLSRVSPYYSAAIFSHALVNASAAVVDCL